MRTTTWRRRGLAITAVATITTLTACGSSGSADDEADGAAAAEKATSRLAVSYEGGIAVLDATRGRTIPLCLQDTAGGGAVTGTKVPEPGPESPTAGLITGSSTLPTAGRPSAWLTSVSTSAVALRSSDAWAPDRTSQIQFQCSETTSPGFMSCVNR